MNKVIIFGLEHYNSLGLVRAFGVNGIKPYGILVGKKNNRFDSYASKSKFWKKTWIVDSEEEGINKIIDLFSNEKEKAVIVPSSDGAEVIIDQNLERLKKFFFVPGIGDKQGAVSRLMNKTTQAEWAHSIGLKTAESWELDLEKRNSIEQIKKYPCILKPVLSSEGEKSDIIKCENRKSAENAIATLVAKGYKRILAQEFLTKDYEVELFGCITKNSRTTPYLLSKHLREWPPIAGSVSCHEFIVDREYKKDAEEILSKIRDYGYTGNIDIELFMIQGELYLNEVNFRNSGDVYACFYNKVFYPVIWYLDIIGNDTSNFNTYYDNSKYAMNETTDFRHVIFGKLRFKEWLEYYKNCADFALKFKKDMRPAIARYISCLSKIREKGKIQKKLAK